MAFDKHELKYALKIENIEKLHLVGAVLRMWELDYQIRYEETELQ